MMIFKGIVSLALLKVCSSQQTAWHTFVPKASVTDHAAIDLDQQEIEAELDKGTEEGFATAEAIYKTGGHSKPYAVVSIATALAQELPLGTPVTGPSVDGTSTTGKLLDVGKQGDTILKVQYSTTDDRANHVGCQVGASDTPKFDLCLADNGTITVGSTIQQQLEYSYNHTVDNENFRTLQGFSLQANKKMTGYVDFEKYRSYYGIPNYGDEWCLAAFEGRETRFPNMGNVDFTNKTIEARSESVRRGMTLMNVWMYSIREFEDALDDCDNNCAVDGCNDDKVSAWDEGVAFYSGSLVDTKKSYLLYALANKGCANFKTCGPEGDDNVKGNSFVNIELFKMFNDGQEQLLKGECKEVRELKEKMVNFMTVPLIQGTLRYAYELNMEMEFDLEERSYFSVQKSQAEGNVYAQAVLPLLHACSPEDAEIVRKSMPINNETIPDFNVVRQAFERNYKCLGITCEMVGGLASQEKPYAYLDDARPCTNAQLLDTTRGNANSAAFSSYVPVSIIGVVTTMIVATMTMFW